ncbi:MAG TPA: hypothetical protein VIV12_00810, partial [Streptosporangiaceae bacterium]
LQRTLGCLGARGRGPRDLTSRAEASVDLRRRMTPPPGGFRVTGTRRAGAASPSETLEVTDHDYRIRKPRRQRG